MNYLFNVLKAIFFGNRSINAEEIKYENIEQSNPEKVSKEPDVPIPDENIVQYDPLSETEVILTPLSSPEIEFYNIYSAQAAAQLLFDKCDYYLISLDATSAMSVGAVNELSILSRYLKTNINHYQFRIFWIGGYVVLSAGAITNDSDDWYYCTQLELPEGRFNPIILTVTKKPQEETQKAREYKLDHSLAGHGGGR